MMGAYRSPPELSEAEQYWLALAWASGAELTEACVALGIIHRDRRAHGAALIWAGLDGAEKQWSNLSPAFPFDLLG